VPSAEPLVRYADSSALVKLVIDEDESEDLAVYLGAAPALLSSRLATVEVLRAARIANPASEEAARRLLDSCVLVDVSRTLLRAAGVLASPAVRTLDAIHLATAQRVQADEFLAYDRRLAAAASVLGFAVSHPGMEE
jgi:predicted nucleic acid-binding protein